MAIACPNKKSKEWLFLVDKLGETSAYKVFLHNKESVPAMTEARKYVAMYRPDVKKARLETQYNAKKGGLLKYTPNEFKSLTLAVNNFNKKVGYNALEASANEETGKMWVKFGTKDANETVAQSKEKHASYDSWWNSLSKEGKISENARRVQDGGFPIDIDNDGTPYYQKYSSMESETLEQAQTKVDYLQSIFGVGVELDPELDAAGQVLPGKAGETPTIVINPNKLSEDTVTHEYGHIFIDALGGLKNGRISAAVKQLEGTDLWAEVVKHYPELSGEALAKEVLATALGRESAEIFANDNYKQNWWTRFKNWFLERIASKLGKDRDYVKELAQDLFNPNNSKLTLVSSTYVQQSKASKASKISEAVQKEQLTVEQLNKKAQDKLISKQKILKEQGHVKYAKSLQDSLDAIKVATVTSPALGIYKFVLFAQKEMEILDKGLSKSLDEHTVTADSINTKTIFSGIFEDIDMFINILNENKADLDKAGVHAVQLRNALDNLARNKNSFAENLKKATIRTGAAAMAEHSNYSQGIAKIKFEREANKLKLTGAEKEAFIQKEMKKDQPNWFEQDVIFYTNLLTTTVHDIDWLESTLLDATNINSHTIQIAHAIMNGASTLTRKHTKQDEDAIAAAWKKFGGETKSGAPSDIYSFMYNEGSDGFMYVVGKYSPEFNIKYNELQKKVQKAADEFGEKSPESQAAGQELLDWQIDNTTAGKPSNKWLDPKFDKMSKEQSDFWKFTKLSLGAKDSKTRSRDRLHTNIYGIKDTGLFQLPSINRKSMETLHEEGLFATLKNKIRDSFTKQGDDTEFGKSEENEAKENEKKKGLKAIYTMESGEQRREIPVFFRNKVKEPSVDIPSLLLMNAHTVNNYSNKYAILPKINILAAATKNKRIGKSEGMGLKKLLVNKNTGSAVTKDGSESREYATLLSIIEDNIYGVSTIDLGEMMGMNVNKLLNSVAGWTSDTMLMLNYLSGGANLMQGKAMNFIEQMSKGKLGRKALLRGEKMFWADSANWMADVGKTHQVSQTNLLMDLFNVKGDYSALSTAFFKNNRAKALASTDNLHFMNNLGEYYTASTLMYSLLSEIKVMDVNREYLDKNGKVVKTKGEAASLADVYKTVDGKLVVQFGDTYNANSASKLGYTSLDMDKPYNEASVANYMKSVYSDLHGQYDKELQSVFQRQAAGKMMMMLRKWMLPGYLRRYRGFSGVLTNKEDLNPQDKFYSQAKGTEVEGNYTTAVRFTFSLFKGMKEAQFRTSWQNNWDTMTDYEKTNVKKATIEIALMVGSLVASTILYGLAGDEDDEQKRKALFATTFYLRRFYSELSFFVNPQEALRILRTPAASVSLLESSLRLFHQANKDLWNLEFEEYQRGPKKGEPKIIKKLEQVVPVVKNLRRDVENSTDFLYNDF